MIDDDRSIGGYMLCGDPDEGCCSVLVDTKPMPKSDPWLDKAINIDGTVAVKTLSGNSIHLILSDIPYGIGIDDWDVLHPNVNLAYLGTSPAQKKAGAVFRRRGKPLNGWSQADKQIPLEYQKWCANFASEWFRVLKPGGSAFIFAGRRLAHRCVCAFEDAGFILKDQLAWLRERAPHRAQRLSLVFARRGEQLSANQWIGWKIGNLRPIFEPIQWFMKPYPVGGTLADNVLTNGVGAFNEVAFMTYEGSPDNILRSGFETGERGFHIAQKPTRLMEGLIRLTTRTNDIVLDPFCGSGSTLVAAKTLGRHYIGFDTDPSSIDIAQKRLENRKNENR